MNKRYLTSLLVVSVLLNILLIGAIGGHWYSGKGRGPYDRHHTDLQALLSELPKDKAEWIVDVMDQSRKIRHQHFKAIKQARQEAMDILVAEQFDVDAFQQKLAALHQLSGDFKQQQMQGVVELAERLTVEERRVLSRFLLKGRGFKKAH